MDQHRMALYGFNRTTWIVIAIVAAIFVVGAIYAHYNSLGNDTSGDVTRPVVNDAPPAANVSPSTDRASPATPSPAAPPSQP